MKIETRNSFKYNTQTGLLAVGLAGFLVSGCSSVPEWANPIEWYSSTKGWVTGESKGNIRARPASAQIPGKNKSFPKLASVGVRPEASNDLDRKNILKSLAADRRTARYLDRQARNENKNMAGAVKPSGMAAPVTPVEIRPVVPHKDLRKKMASIKPISTDKRKPDKVPKFVFGLSSAKSIKQGQPISVAQPLSETEASGIKSPQKFVQALPYSIRFPAGFSDESKGAVLPTSINRVIVNFDVGSAKLSNTARRQVRKAVQLSKRIGRGLHVIGHASSRTRNLEFGRHQMANFRISYDRANAVALEVRRLGIAEKFIRVSAMSDSEPASSEVMPKLEAKNRRVVIVMEK
jgi:outer membrane protein OmpA-like peptidoglycan-associated protein